MASVIIDEKAIFNVAREIASPAARAEYLRQACGADPSLFERIQVLLRAYEGQASFLESPPVMGVSPTLDQPVAETPGTVIGPYKLLQQIGEGGMGVVWMAEQSEPVKRKVALKVIKPGMDSRQVIARFEAERQALAMMDHVNIARVFDGGTTGGEPGVSAPGFEKPPAYAGGSPGRPYFVMELVHGVPITKYCDDNHLTPRERLELFVPVCQAIQHAHQKGIIHRDIKPSNVMVTLYDGKPVPKVIDFGVAKATEQKLTERTLFTQYGTMVGTLEYMSPEQAEMSALGVDTRSDIYSLGVLLYELLTGSTPLTSKRMKEAAYAEILRMIKEEEPPKPSTRLSDSGEALASISANRHTEPAKLTKLVRGELDWIVMKGLEKDRNRRYETANGFAMDVQRYLNDEPVLACPPSVGYRLRKFVRRNKAAMGTAALLATALIVAVVALAVSNVWVRRERNEKTQALHDKEEALQEKEAALKKVKASYDKAEAERQRAEKYFLRARMTVSRLLLQMGSDQGGEWSQIPVSLRKKFAAEALQFYEQFMTEGSADPQLRFDTGWAYWQIGVLHRRWGDHEQSEKAFCQAIAVLEPLAAEFPSEANYRQHLAFAHFLLGQRQRRGRSAQAESSYQRAVQLYERLLADFPEHQDYRYELGLSLIDLGDLLATNQRLREGEPMLRRALGLNEQLVAEFPASAKYRFALARCEQDLGQLWFGSERIVEAEQAMRRAEAILEKLVRDHPKDPEFRTRLIRNYSLLADLFNATNRREEAAQPDRRILELAPKQVRAPNNLAARSETAEAYFLSGRTHATTNRWGKAASDLLKAVELEPNDAEAWLWLARAHDHFRRWKESIGASTKAIELRPTHAEAYHQRGLAHQRLRQWDRSLADFSQAVQLRPDYLAVRTLRGFVFAELGRWEEASADLERACTFPQARSAWSAYALVRLQLGDREGYRKACATLLERFADPKDHNGAAEAVRTCAVAPGAVADPGKLVQIATELAAHQKELQNYGYDRLLAHALYRAGQYEEVIRRLDDPKKGWFAEDMLFLAMAYHHRGEAVKARSWLKRASASAAKNMPEKQPETANQMPWNMRLRVQLLGREAEALVLGNGKSQAAP